MNVSTITERDVSINEALLILHKEEYVDFSLQFRHANVDGTRVVETVVDKETDLATDSNNWQERYWSRETDSSLKQLVEEEGCAREVCQNPHPLDFH